MNVNNGPIINVRGRIEDMKKIAFYNRKGGVGKTTCCVNTSYSFALMGKKTLIIDLDNQNSCSLFLGINKKIYNKRFDNIFTDDNFNLEDAIYQVNDMENLFIIPCSDLKSVESFLYASSRPDLVFKRRLSELENMDFDYIFIDCAPSTSKINDAILLYVENLVIPVQLQTASVNAVSDIYEYLNELDISPDVIKLVVPNMYRKTSDSDVCLAFLKTKFDESILTEPINLRTKITEATTVGIPAINYDKEASTEFLKIISKVVERIG